MPGTERLVGHHDIVQPKDRTSKNYLVLYLEIIYTSSILWILGISNSLKGIPNGQSLSEEMTAFLSCSLYTCVPMELIILISWVTLQIRDLECQCLLDWTGNFYVLKDT